MASTARTCWSRRGSAASTTWSSRSASASSSSVALKAATRSLGRSRMKPTVSVMITSRSRGKRSRRLVGIEGGEELVLHQHRGVGEGVEQRRLAGVGVADDGEDRQAAVVALPPAQVAVLGEAGHPPLQRGDPVAHPAAVDLQLGLAGAAAADAAGQARERVVAPGQARVEVLELRQLHLQLAVGALRPLREDVEDQLGAVEDLEAGGLGDVAGLRRREVGVEDDQVRHQLHGAEQDVLQLPLADERARVDLVPVLQRGVHHLDAGGAGQLLQLLQRRLALLAATASAPRPPPGWPAPARRCRARCGPGRTPPPAPGPRPARRGAARGPRRPSPPARGRRPGSRG